MPEIIILLCMHLSFFRLLNFFIPVPVVAFFRLQETFIGVVVYAPHIQFTIISTTLQADVVIYRHLGLRMCSKLLPCGLPISLLKFTINAK